VFNNGSVLSNISYKFFKSWVEKVSEPGNLVPRNFFELRVLQKIFQKIFQHFEITLFTQLTNYNYSTLFTLYALTSAAFKYLTEINSFTDSCHHNEVNGNYMFCKVSKKMQIK
jgi:hypothetical protein